MPHHRFRGKDDLKKCLQKDIHVWRVVIWRGVNRMIIHFSKSSNPPSIRSSILPFLYIIQTLNLQCGIELNQFRPPTSGFCKILILLYILFGGTAVNCSVSFFSHIPADNITVSRTKKLEIRDCNFLRIYPRYVAHQ